DGFRRAAHPADLEPLVATYVEALNPIWESRSYHMAEELISGLYPKTVASQGLAAALQGWLDANLEAAPALRRLVEEELSDTRRALAAQQVA
ncbi:MAG: aminopeptidase N, partial [Promicromonosporaceae bacterium]|nr:aminopeptidase N [Promicromonosporaceae bacterium]